ncbi:MULTISPECIES: LCP family protein [unclassified Nocardia]|uniref:LCP family protein n=1 Tax=unclassified Nocardia TaxID=2637762 RepID=UPI00278C5B20|nr:MULTISPECIES: LCP family protein [unclassified Nocardia]
MTDEDRPATGRHSRPAPWERTDRFPTRSAHTTPDEPTRHQSLPAPWMTAVTDQYPPAPESAPAPRSRRERRRSAERASRRRVRVLGRGVVTVVSVLTLLGTGGAWQYLHAIDDGFTHVDALDLDSEDVVDPGGQRGDETFLIVGTDSRAGTNGQMGAGSATDVEGARADTVMLITIPANRQRVVAVSFPRDLDVSRPACPVWDNATAGYSDQTLYAADGVKLNGVYAEGGPRCLVKVIQKISGLRIGHFIGIDFAGFETMVDQIGGVEVCTPTPLIDDLLGAVLPTAGRQTIDGATALDYVRARHIRSDPTSDYGRIKRQQRFLSALLRSALSGKVLLDPGKLNSVITAFANQTFVENVTPQDLLTLGRSLQNVNAGAVTFLTVPTAGTNDAGNEIPRMSDIRAIFGAIIDDTPLPGEERTPMPVTTTLAAAVPATDPAETVDPEQITVRVANATTTPGLASTTATELAGYGYTIASVGNHPETSSDTVIRFPAGQRAAADTLATLVPDAALEETTENTDGIDLILGTDYTGILTPLDTDTTATALPTDLTITNAADDTCA